MDYADDVKYKVSCQAAARKGLIINTVQCGDVPETTQVWQQIARLAEGSYVALAQSGNMSVMATPFDEEIANASAALGDTVIAYGDGARQAEARHKVESAAGAPASVAAARPITWPAGARRSRGGGTFSDIEEGSVDPAKLAAGAAAARDAEDDRTPADGVHREAENRAGRPEPDACRPGQEARRLHQRGAEAYFTAPGTGDAFDTKVAEIIAAEAMRYRSKTTGRQTRSGGSCRRTATSRWTA